MVASYSHKTLLIAYRSAYEEIGNVSLKDEETKQLYGMTDEIFIQCMGARSFAALLKEKEKVDKELERLKAAYLTEHKDAPIEEVLDEMPHKLMQQHVVLHGAARKIEDIKSERNVGV